MPWGAVAGAVASTVVGSILAPDGGGGGGSGGAADAAAAAAALKQSEISGEQWDYFKEFFQPFEKDALLPAGYEIMEAAKNYGSVAEQEKAAGEASTTVALSMGKARDTLGRNLASYGINPNSGRFQDANLKMSLEGAKADAGAQNLARKGIVDQAFGKKIDSINTALNIDAVGRGLPASAQTGLSSAASTNAAIGNSQYLRGQIEAGQTRAGLAPIVSAVSKGVKNWWDGPTTQNNASYVPPSQGVVVNGVDFDNYGDF